MTPTPVFALDEIEPGTARRVEVDGVAVAVVRIGDDVYAIGDTCSHQNVSLAEGEVWCDELELECPKHSSTFSLTTGEPTTLPATQPVPVYTASVVEGQVVISIEAPVGPGTDDAAHDTDTTASPDTASPEARS